MLGFPMKLGHLIRLIDNDATVSKAANILNIWYRSAHRIWAKYQPTGVNNKDKHWGFKGKMLAEEMIEGFRWTLVSTLHCYHFIFIVPNYLNIYIILVKFYLSTKINLLSVILSTIWHIKGMWPLHLIFQIL